MKWHFHRHMVSLQVLYRVFMLPVERGMWLRNVSRELVWWENQAQHLKALKVQSYEMGRQQKWSGHADDLEGHHFPPLATAAAQKSCWQFTGGENKDFSSPSVILLCLCKEQLMELLNITLSSMMVATSGRPWTTLARPGNEQIQPFSFSYRQTWLCFTEGKRLIYLRFSAIAASLKGRENDCGFIY